MIITRIQVNCQNILMANTTRSQIHLLATETSCLVVSMVLIVQSATAQQHFFTKTGVSAAHSVALDMHMKAHLVMNAQNATAQLYILIMTEVYHVHFVALGFLLVYMGMNRKSDK